ncbi:FtsX-like permease family protein [Latilactobacillus graminis]|uniref:Permease family protein n=2 Tax=Latilactobacillus graminis TaxID=60519 RepID=A0AA89L4X4_9LACO|nr:FtsX-like permease family protein [Latilactobacillus graminis]KRM23376.1 permease family protein [Latilactobacillus graminis DSM 20719]QFP80273.1 FtsX-like permease family protein [Latilactobacillus graminis]
MLLKLSLTGIKGRLKDYIVLFSGLIMASAIFYMFEALATNKSFVSSNSPIRMASIIFQIGSVLLGIITLVYIIYANNFLMSMRRRDYGMFMMLGAKGRKIAQLIAAETLVIGMAATLVGTVLGIGLTRIISNLLLSQMDIQVKQFSPFYLPAVIVTVVFFMVLFVMAAGVNQYQLLKTPVLQLLHNDQQPNHVSQNKLGQLVQIVLSLIFLTIGYTMLINVATYQIAGLVVALVTIVLGTYFLFNAFFGWMLRLLKGNQYIRNRGLNNFTLAQLRFRIKDYTKMLALVAMLFALALGAITVGIGYQSEIPAMAKTMAPYDVVLNQPNPQARQLAKNLTGVKATANYDVKEDAQTVYYRATQLKKNPIMAVQYSNDRAKGIKPVQLKTLQKGNVAALQAIQVPSQFSKDVKVVTDAEFSQIASGTIPIKTYRVKDFMANLSVIKKIHTQQVIANPELAKGQGALMDGSKYVNYQMANGMFSGLEFMGFFLGIAFLAMLASCLMFKILSGAASDVKRYTMLAKIGTRRSLLKQSIAKEIGVLFCLPGIVGSIHVLFGLQLFKQIMLNPYQNLWLPFTIFMILYVGYYWVTTWLYQGIVLKTVTQ